MEDTFRWSLVTAIAPIAWGTNYFVTHEYLPAGHPLYGAVFRALPAGLLLLALARRLPRGVWWWRSLLLGICNMGAFFALIYLASQLLPVSLASTIMSAAPFTMALFAWGLLAERPTAQVLIGATAGIAGVVLLLGAGSTAVDLRGVAASAAALTMSSCGYVLTKKWGRAGEGPLAMTSWQLIAGGVVLIPFAIVVEGAPPRLDGPAVAGFAYVGLVATALAFTAWFAGLSRLPAATVGLIGLLNPVTGVLLGVLVSGDVLNLRQVGGLALVLLGITLSQVRVNPPTPLGRVRQLDVTE
ncbi:putative blue pigment (indigoidine) exporter [Kribbella sp. VKM Ac-2569]|uniref:DMT family transporter n=1 Tax=Kribbella sp. VKM Ac-2569 TaxID=2512220 RepID=UPI00102D06EC|nr:EamA family transporter [Kribbella sp. VKM Ac-2569]RZT11826.1 putative blue pigment (indigoidine) exporter [Kribbella sp. VKM Ac-2569]